MGWELFKTFIWEEKGRKIAEGEADVQARVAAFTWEGLLPLYTEQQEPLRRKDKDTGKRSKTVMGSRI